MTEAAGEPKWLTRAMVLAIHDESLAAFGGASGVRDPALLESALARPVNRWHYVPDASVADLAAAYAYGIVRNHPFVDGNKRTGLLVVPAFLFLNGLRFDPEQVEEVRVFLALAAGELSEDDLARWIAGNAARA
jgi:death-on-curing protein